MHSRYKLEALDELDSRLGEEQFWWDRRIGMDGDEGIVLSPSDILGGPCAL